MRRHLLLVLALFAATVTALLLRGSAGPENALPSGAAETPQPATAEESLAGLAAPDATGNQARVRASAGIEAWHVKLHLGEHEAGAAVAVRAQLVEPVAGGRGETPPLEAAGSVIWESVEPGMWALTVSVAEEERWSREVFVPAGRVTRTFVSIGQPIQVEGTVRNVHGDPRKEHFVGFVPDAGRAPRAALDWLQLPHARTSSSGRFRATLPGPGRYRVFAGYGGKVLTEAASAFEVTRESQSSVEIITPVPSTLTLELKEHNGAKAPAGAAVSIYRSKEILDRIRPIPTLPPEPPLPDPSDPTLSEDERGELLAEIEARKVPVDQEALRRRKLVVPRGWRVDRSAAFGVTAELTMTDLPVDEELRFAVACRGEALRVLGNARVDPVQPTRIVITLPPPLADGAPLPPEPRAATLESGLDPAGPLVAQPGVEWR